MTPIAVARFWSKVDVKLNTECWLWRGARDPKDYGRFRNPDTGLTELAHRISYRLLHGALPPPEIGIIRHSCDTPRCCNPFHLLAGTQADNMRDASERGRLVNVHPGHSAMCARGERAPNSTLTEDAVRSIRTRIAAGERPRNLAREFGTSAQNISNITRRRTWNHL
jgi:hypothetical protein